MIPPLWWIISLDTARRGVAVKYFFLSDGWVTGRIWEFGGLWNEMSWQRKPQIQRLDLCIQEQGEILWLYQVEEAVLMVEVCPQPGHPLSRDVPGVAPEGSPPFGQVVLKRLITAEQAIQHLCGAEQVLSAEQVRGIAVEASV